MSEDIKLTPEQEKKAEWLANEYVFGPWILGLSLAVGLIVLLLRAL